MRVLIVGGAGFIGSHLARRFVADGHRVDLLLRPSTDPRRVADLLPTIGIHRVVLSDEAALLACLATVRPTHVVHLAADTRSRHAQGLAQATLSTGMIADLLSLLRAASALPEPPRLFLRAGSIAEYGTARHPFLEEQREAPETGYAAALTACAHLAEAMAPSLNFPVVTARLALVYGPGQAEDFLVPALVRSCVEGRAMRLLRPLDRRDLIHVADAAELLYRLTRQPDPRSGVINLGSRSDVGVSELADIVAALAGADPALFAAAEQPGPPAVLRLATGRMTHIMGEHRLVPLKLGLQSLIADAQRTEVARAA